MILFWLAITAFMNAGTNTAETNKKPSIVFLITEDTNNYRATTTVPKFAELLEKDHGYETTVLLGTGGHGDYK